MRLPILAVVILAAVLTGCARVEESRFNPKNWGGPPRAAPVLEVYVRPVDPRPLVGQVTLLKVEPYPGGAIVRATGVPSSQGYWEAELVALPVDEAGRLVYEFRVFPPRVAAVTGTQYARQITVAAAISDIALQGVRTVVVQGADNAMSARR